MYQKSSEPQRIARRVLIRGVVQGVGFRPLVYRLAARHQVAGWVLNDEAGVELHAEASPADIEAFLTELRDNPPAAARISHFEVQDVAPQGIVGFQILASQHGSIPTVRISPDLTTCADCLRELTDRSNRRYGYPYINCTNCGPRYSIIQSLPYDRKNTTMRRWELCPRCRSEFEDPLDRRYHAQPIACEQCGPGFCIFHSESRMETKDKAIRCAAELLASGSIVAIKGIGGYHLACDARNATAVEALRERKYRKEKPFALLVRWLAGARELVDLSPEHEKLLTDVARPIVLAPAKIELAGVSPDNHSLGVMLAYTPLHHLLFDSGAPSPLVLTSANRSSEPIAYNDLDALDRLTGIADAFLIGGRPIARRVDDSVVAVRCGQPFMIRRARGYAPGAVCTLPTDRTILALGSDLKNTIALVVRGEVFVSQHIGDLGDDETDRAFEETVRDFLAMYKIDPRTLIVAHDLHPQFKSTRFAATLPAERRVAVQHHHAHIASVLAEHRLLDQRVIGVAFDGTGYGTDGSIWGGEFFVGSVPEGFEHVASLKPVAMPGGDAAARFPVQAAAGFLSELTDLPDMNGPPFDFPQRFNDALALVAKRVRCFTSTSMGRLFDATAALLGFTAESTFEGQAAIWLEHQATQCSPQPPYPFPDLDWRPLLRSVINDRLLDRPVAEISAAFHSAIAAATVTKIRALAEQHNLRVVALSGGVFQNELLLTLIHDAVLDDPGLRFITNQSVPVNDGGISLGQAALVF